MFRRTLTTDFFSTINFNLFLRSLYYVTFGLYKLRKGDNNQKLQVELKAYLGALDSKLINFYNGRSAIYNCLKGIGVKKNDEILINAYTCVSLVNAIQQTGAKVKYSDINTNNYGFDINALKDNINKKTKVIIVQHTFGKNSNIQKIINIAKKNNILVIEDCCHSLGTKINKKHLGTFGDFAIFSTGRDKVISSVTGGFLLINNNSYLNKFKTIEKKIDTPSIKLTIKNHLYNIIAYISYKLYNILSIGKVIMHISNNFGFITKILTKNEKNCNYKEFNYKLPNSLAGLAVSQLEKIKHYNNHRRNLAFYYDKKLNNKNIKIGFKQLKSEKNNYFRYPVLLNSTKEAKRFYKYMRKNKILLGKTWSYTSIAPVGSDLDKCNFKLKNNQKAVDISSRMLFLPNHSGISLSNAKYIVKVINKF